MNYLFYEWFVRYNPLYFVSAACFVIGVFLVSKGMHNINFIDGQIILTAVIESYEILLLAGSFILFRMVSQTRPAVILAIMNIFFLFDCTYQTEHISSVQYLGGLSTVLWIILFALKLKALTWIFRLKLPLVGFIVPIFAAVGIAGTPYLLYYTSIDKSLIHLTMTWYGVVLAVLFLWFRPTVVCRKALDDESNTILLRIFNAAWMIWGGFYLFHLISWIRFFDIEINLANIAPVFMILPFVTEEESWTWVGSILTILSSLSDPSICWFTALIVGLVFCLKGWKNRQPRLYIGAILALHFSFLTIRWQNYPVPDPALWLTVSTGVGLLAIGWVFRLISAFLTVLFGVFIFWNPRGPQDIMEWGSLFIAIGFATLVAGIIMNWKLQFTSIHIGKGQIPPPLKTPNPTSSANSQLQAQDCLKNPCPSCQLNLKTGNDRCDECGREFY
jgi:hypothetical protein